MIIRFSCSCGKELQARDEHARGTTRCPDCGAEQVIPCATSERIQASPEPAVLRRYREAEQDDFEKRPLRQGPTGTSSKAWASLNLGVASFVFTLLTGVPAIIVGIWSLVNISRSHGRLKGSGLAITGIVLGLIGSLMGPAVLTALLLRAEQKVREAAAQIQSANNLHQIGLTMLNHNEEFGYIPPGNCKATAPNGPMMGNYGNNGLSWRVALLPFLDQDSLYEQFHLDEPWDSPHNKTLLTRIPKVYQHPNADPEMTAAGLTYYRAFVGPGTAFDPSAGHNIRMPVDFPDGLPTTLLVVESSEPIEWTRPESVDFHYDPSKPLPKLGAFWSSGTVALMGDASTHLLKKDISEQTLRALITRNGKDPIGPDF
jgi:hypothetical protein